MGQPWHQDSSIFPFEPSRPVVAAWIALTDATESNSCLRVVPSSHKADVAPHGRDQSAATAGRYVSLVDQDVATYTSLVMSPEISSSLTVISSIRAATISQRKHESLSASALPPPARSTARPRRSATPPSTTGCQLGERTAERLSRNRFGVTLSLLTW